MEVTSISREPYTHLGSTARPTRVAEVEQLIARPTPNQGGLTTIRRLCKVRGRKDGAKRLSTSCRAGFKAWMARAVRIRSHVDDNLPIRPLHDRWFVVAGATFITLYVAFVRTEQCGRTAPDFACSVVAPPGANALQINK